MATLRSTVGTFSHVYIVLDALDESPERPELLTLLDEIYKWGIDGVHVLATSRQERDIEGGLKSLVSHDVSMDESLVDGDIRVHVTRIVDDDAVFQTFSADDRNGIKSTLIDGAHGM